MQISNGNISRVRTGEAKAYKNLNTGFAFEVVGDGKFEPSVSSKLKDTFGSAMAVDDVDALGTFLKNGAALEAQVRPSPETPPMEKAEHGAKKTEMAKTLTGIAEESLGRGWQVTEDSLSYNQYGGINYFTADRKKDGVEQGVYVERNRDQGFQVRMSAKVPGEPGQSTAVSQSLEFEAEADTGVVKPDSIQETAFFNFA